MTPRRCYELLVLDAHGVVLNDPFADFLDWLARETRQDPEELRRRWTHDLRTPAWRGHLGETELWSRLVGSADFAKWREALERRYRPGPAAPHLERWSRRLRLWMLSNHTTAALRARLDRLDLARPFERILVSDRLGAAKPEAGAFAPLLRAASDPAAVLFVDDQMKNVAAGHQAGFTTIHATPSSGWVAIVDDLLSRHMGGAPAYP